MNRLPSVSSLISPPEPKPYDSFSSPTMQDKMSLPGIAPSYATENTLPPIYNSQCRGTPYVEVLPSPPVSPWANDARKPEGRFRGDSITEDGSVQGENIHDPPLFSSRHNSDAGLAPDVPLFPPQPIDPNVDALVSRHMASHLVQFNGRLSQPTRDEYLLALSCIPKISERVNRNPQGWLKRERDILDERFGQAQRVWKRPATKSFVKLAPAPAGAKHDSVPAARNTVRPARTAPRQPKVKRTPPTKVLDSFASTVPATPKQRAIGTSREDTDYVSLPDYSPPTSSLPKSNPKILKADWRGQVLDLSNDPDRHMLHEAEVNLAATLRLSCATYLCSKRRIFQARLQALRIGKEFRKTDSQQACKIDVNKASKLWTAYERVGWFKREHFEKYL
ncbi:hypothetical protein L228DRAFT_270007 [Xylona heveae TC161]|uniref:SWIRM domain-containing protein n=1 Tax=Xylona heveae (strain CBS 132557 / TC161) TaxID=1328760 RepID=A0A165F8V0_XYLHT|nr:hypothetical protein L228DRAFT_270007 [Xylona heveae TC161]KZF20713.1 hypothetical protein L228DRAFT_270007 [Xylona heveae TC161]